MRYGASVVWNISLPLMNRFNKTEAAYFPCRLFFLRAFPDLFKSFFVCFGSVEQCPEIDQLHGVVEYTGDRTVFSFARVK